MFEARLLLLAKSVKQSKKIANILNSKNVFSCISTGRAYASKPAKLDSFLNANSATYVEDMYKAWLKNPTSVHASWDSFFRNSADGSVGYQSPPTLGRLNPLNETTLGAILPAIQNIRKLVPDQQDCVTIKSDTERNIEKHLLVQLIIRSYQTRGHLVADLDPLDQRSASLGEKYENYEARKGKPSSRVVRDYLHGFTEKDMNQVFKLPKSTHIGGDETALPLKEIIARLEKKYCHHIGVEYMHITSVPECDFIRQHHEPPNAINYTSKDKRKFWMRLERANGFEAFLAKKYTSEKRFGLEGSDALIPCLKQIIDVSSLNGVDTFIIGMAHRGRLNVLTNVCNISLTKLFAQFAGLKAADVGSGDEKYHLGTSQTFLNRETNKMITVAVLANPSHLEAINPVAQGKCRAEQFYKGDSEGKKVVTIQIHGDAAFCGQGVVYESLHLSDLPEYTTHGVIHVVVNNQIGFTTDPRYSRSSPYCTDVARVVNAPIFHVDGDDIENVMHVTDMASNFRATFYKDVVIDLVSYRRHGHNEIDEPMFTQPLMYKLIKKIKPVSDKYSEKLIKEKVITAEEIKKYRQEYADTLEKDFQAAKKVKFIKYSDWIDSPWSGFFKGKDLLQMKSTGVKEEVLLNIAKKYARIPPADFVVHKGIERILKQRMEFIEQGVVDWAIGEALAYGTLLKEGYHCRLSGQDVERGTFSHRHYVLHHQDIDKIMFKPIHNLFPDQAPFSLCNSPISELGVLGFEIGYSITNPNALIVWEGQFGDFANGAQIMIDQFISSGQTKWVRQSGIVVNLPHGMEGMGPEHSQARIERFLQMSNDDPDYFPPEGPDFVMRQLHSINWIVANATSPANFFHLLRRQIYMPFRKPLIHMAPKSGLRHPGYRSTFKEMIEGTVFQRIYFDEGPASKNPEKVRKVIFCSGKVYFDFLDEREKKKLTAEIAIIRLEQVCPFPFDLIKQICAKYSKAHLIWGQEDAKNFGCWSYIEPRFNTVLNRKRRIFYVGRPSSSSPATGSKVQYKNEFNQFLAEAFA